MKDILLIIGGGYIGWWLALNKEQETRQALKNAKNELEDAKEELVRQLNENEKLKTILEDEEFRTG